jgi:hypothetical protein
LLQGITNAQGSAILPAMLQLQFHPAPDDVGQIGTYASGGIDAK